MLKIGKFLWFVAGAIARVAAPENAAACVVAIVRLVVVGICLAPVVFVAWIIGGG
jgi:hypothetical protein